MNTTWMMVGLLVASQRPMPKPAVLPDATAAQGGAATTPTTVTPNASTAEPATSDTTTPSMGSPNATSDAEAPAERAPWPGTLAEGFDELRSLAQKQQYESARILSDALLAPNSFLRWKQDQSARGGWRRSTVHFVEPFLDWCGFDGLDDRVRSEVYYARGVVGALAKDREAAEDDFQRARGLAVDRALSDAALYDVGWLALDAGEEARATIPEISGKPPAPPAPTMPNPGAGPSPASGAPTKPPDPLQVARTAYLKAREHFVERLRSESVRRATSPNDASIADTRANVELCLKRLRELDEIEKKREEEKKKQEQQKKDDKKQDSKDDKDKDKDPKKDEQKPEDSKDPTKDPKDSDPNKKPEDEKKPEPPKDPKDDETKDEKAKPPRPTEAKEGEMSKEQMTQLLDRLQQLEEESRKIQAALKAARRANVKKDW